MRKNWKVAIIGCGAFCGSQYLPYINKISGAELVALCDIIPERASSYAEKAQAEQWFTHIDALLEGCSFDILMNATAIPAHHEINMKALSAGKHVFTQKPAALTVAEVTTQMELAARKGVKMNAAPVHSMRHANREAARMIADGVIGQVTTALCQIAHGGPEYFQYRENDPSWFYETGSGALYDMGVHGLDYVVGLLGPADSVSCRATISEPLRQVRSGRFDGRLIQSDRLPDNYLISLGFGQATIGEVYTSYCQRATRMPLLEIYGTKGVISFVKDPQEARPHLEVYLDHPGQGIRGWMRPLDLAEREKPFFDCLCLQDLIDAIEQDKEPVLTMEKHRHLVEIMEQIPRCIETGSTLPLTTTF